MTWTTFPLLPINSDGTCGCGDRTCKDGGKHPSCKWGEKSLGAGAQVPVPPGFGVGLATGARSDVIVIDLDRKGGVDGLAALRALGEVPDTLAVATPTGGFHLYFKHPGFRIGNSASVIGPGIDVRGDGGYVVLPPSPHKVGGHYEWIDQNVPIADLPGWLVTLLSSGARRTLKPRLVKRDRLQKVAKSWKRAKSAAKQEMGEALERVCNGESFAPPGERDTTIFQMTQDLAKELPYADAHSVAEHFAPSLELMAGEAPDCPTVNDVAEKLARALASLEHRDAPAIVVTADMKLAIDQAEKALARVGGLYRRGDAIVREVRDDAPPPQLVREAGTPTIGIVPPAAVREALSSGASWVVGDGEGLPPTWVVDGLLARSTWPSLPPLEAITEIPLTRRDTTVIDTPGYDTATGILYRPRREYPHIPDRPTAADLARALDAIADVLWNVAFESPAHYAAFLAAVLTPIARPAFDGPAPLFLFDAPTAGSGKGMLAKVAGLIGSGRWPAIAQFPKEEDERKKAITTYVMAGDPIVSFDNVTGRLGGDALCTALTEPVWTDRVLGASRKWSGPMRTVFYATSNNAQLGTDMDRRAVHIRIDPGVERPEERTGFRYPNLLDHVRAVQPSLTAAAITVLRAYTAAGRPAQTFQTWGSYESWASLVVGAVRFAGLSDPGETRLALRAADPDAEYIRALVNGWANLGGAKGITVRDVVAKVFPNGGWQRPIPVMAEAIEHLLRLDKHESPTATKLSGLLRRYAGRVVDGQKLVVIGDNGHDSKLWAVRSGVSGVVSDGPESTAVYQ